VGPLLFRNLANSKQTTMEIKEGHKYKTREGLIGQIWFIGENGDFPVKGAIYHPTEGEWLLKTWTKEGAMSFNRETPDDLVEELTLIPITEGDYITRDGREAKVFMVAEKGNYPIIGAVLLENDTWFPNQWGEKGYAFSDNREHPFDLVERKH